MKAQNKDQVTLRLRTEAEAAQALNKSTKTLRRWRQKGILPFIRLGAQVAYTDQILEKFLSDNTRNMAA